MGRPLLPIWKEFVTTVPSSDDKRSPDVACMHCREVVLNARPVNLMRHASRCREMPVEVRLRLQSDVPTSATLSREELEMAMSERREVNRHDNQVRNDSQVQNEDAGEEEQEEVETPPERRPVLGKRPRAFTPPAGLQEPLERVLTSIRDVMTQTLELRQQELQLRREELQFQKEALATKMEDRRQAREEDRRDRKEQREADRKERLELAKIENEKNLAFLKAVMESSAQQRR
ncbi:hypothetical protein DVH05_019431 [Phytophthora capsici]|nr:hypothetical protein DVH05_028151 [Phytophthora capsici]KAG1695692.1 hypothetical protein DVH05_019431 [Phytophthora capsici]|eukprot:jgi/Phyca11/509744/fgenesh2_kg.PHYCAscaffold_49_\